MRGPRRSPAAKAAGPLGKGGARERPEFSPSGGNGGKRTLRRRRNEKLGIFGVGAGLVMTSGRPHFSLFTFHSSPKGVGVIGGDPPYTKIGRRVGIDIFA